MGDHHRGIETKVILDTGGTNLINLVLLLIINKVSQVPVPLRLTMLTEILSSLPILGRNLHVAGLDDNVALIPMLDGGKEAPPVHLEGQLVEGNIGNLNGIITVDTTLGILTNGIDVIIGLGNFVDDTGNLNLLGLPVQGINLFEKRL